jgi:hypothetical protein
VIVLCLATSLAGALSGAALAHDLGYRVGLLFASAPATGWDWQALALTGSLGLLALELAIGVFGRPGDGA